MGEYARDFILDKFGVDIGSRHPDKPKQVKKFGCACGRVFLTLDAKEQHQKATGHSPKEK